jgi:hypothetical protein
MSLFNCWEVGMQGGEEPKKKKSSLSCLGGKGNRRGGPTRMRVDWWEKKEKKIGADFCILASIPTLLSLPKAAAFLSSTLRRRCCCSPGTVLPSSSFPLCFSSPPPRPLSPLRSVTSSRAVGQCDSFSCFHIERLVQERKRIYFPRGREGGGGGRLIGEETGSHGSCEEGMMPSPSMRRD